MNDIAEFSKSRPNVNYRHFFKPSESLGGSKAELDFRNETTWFFQEVGRKDAQAALDRGMASEKAPEHSFVNVMTANYNTVKEQFEKFTSYFN